MTPLELILERLQAAKRSDRGWVARCPAHSDRHPSLSATEGADGRVLLHCHAGCKPAAVVAALGLEMKDLMPPTATSRSGSPSRHNGHGRAPQVFGTAADAVAELERQHGPRSKMWTYENAGGEPVGVIVRWDRSDGRKDIRPVSRTPAGWVIGGMPVPRPLYRLKTLDGAQRVYVAEGEKSAEALIELGLVATTSPHGAQAAKAADWSPLAGKDVVIVPDNDAAGEKYAKTVADQLAKLSPAPSIRILRLAGLPPSGDAVEYVAARRADGVHHEAIRAELEATVADATPVHPDVAESGPGPVLVHLADVQPEEVKWLWPGRIPLRKLTLIAGDPGLGKSFLTLDMAARVSSGTPFPDSPGTPNPAGGVVLLSAEDDPADTVRPRLDAAGAHVKNVIALVATRAPDPETGGTREAMVNLSVDLPELEAAISAVPSCRLVVIDPISAYLGSVDSHRNTDVRAVLAPLAHLARRSGVAVVAVTHLRKGEGPAIYRAMGSLGFIAAARAAHAVARDREDESGRRRLFLPVKNNLATDVGGLAFELVPSGCTAIVAWESAPVVMSADDALGMRSPRGPRPDKRSGAREWLRGLLVNDSVAASEIKQKAKDAGLAWATVRRASEDLGIRPRRVGFGEEACWQWSLPTRADIGAHVHSVGQNLSNNGELEHLRPGDAPGEGLDATEGDDRHIDAQEGGVDDRLRSGSSARDAAQVNTPGDAEQQRSTETLSEPRSTFAAVAGFLQDPERLDDGRIEAASAFPSAAEWVSTDNSTTLPEAVVKLAAAQDDWTPTAWRDCLLDRANACEASRPVEAAALRRAPIAMTPAWAEAFDERAAIMEHEAGLPRDEAETAAVTDTIRNMEHLSEPCQ